VRELIDSVRTGLGRALPLEFRMDAAFFQREILRLLAARGCAYATKSATGGGYLSGNWPPSAAIGRPWRRASPGSSIV
jgi:hypothetical protein